MKTVLNNDHKMSEEMMEALTIFEGRCIILKIKETTEREVKEFIADLYDQELADSFKTKYLY